MSEIEEAKDWFRQIKDWREAGILAYSLSEKKIVSTYDLSSQDNVMFTLWVEFSDGSNITEVYWNK